MTTPFHMMRDIVRNVERERQAEAAEARLAVLVRRGRSSRPRKERARRGSSRESPAGAGVATERDAIARSLIGERSSRSLLLAQQVLGHPKVPNYDAFWIERDLFVGVRIGI